MRVASDKKYSTICVNVYPENGFGARRVRVDWLMTRVVTGICICLTAPFSYFYCVRVLEKSDPYDGNQCATRRVTDWFGVYVISGWVLGVAGLICTMDRLAICRGSSLPKSKQEEAEYVYITLCFTWLFRYTMFYIWTYIRCGAQDVWCGVILCEVTH